MPDSTAELHAEPLPRIVPHIFTTWHIGVMSMGISFILLGFCLPA